MISVEIPIRTVSESNARGHWAKGAKRTSVNRSAAAIWVGYLAAQVRHLDMLTVTLTRVAPRELDDDNVRGALKAVRDGIADALGTHDRDPRIEWRYAQARGRPRQYAVRVEIRAAEVS